MSYWEQARDAGQRQVDFANSQLSPPEPDYELVARLGDVAGFNVIECVRRQIDARNLTMERLQQEVEIHVKYGRLSTEEAQRVMHSALFGLD